jgi:hypothetical protein
MLSLATHFAPKVENICYAIIYDNEKKIIPVNFLSQHIIYTDIIKYSMDITQADINIYSSDNLTIRGTICPSQSGLNNQILE